jgi:lipid-binding SYLF domain-containing protein
MRFRTIGIAALAALLAGTSASAQLSSKEAKRLTEAARVLSEIRNAPDNGIPEAIWNKAECVVVIPSLKKGGFIVGAETGSGVLSCKHANQWGAPVFMELTKGSVGLQAGVQEIDLVLMIMNRRGVEKLLSNKVTLGADASVAAGPVGRAASAATDAQMSAEMLSYSRARGLFAGIDLSGGTLRPDKSKNARAYGNTVSAKDVALGTAPVTLSDEAKAFTEALRRDVRPTTGEK